MLIQGRHFNLWVWSGDGEIIARNIGNPDSKAGKLSDARATTASNVAQSICSKLKFHEAYPNIKINLWSKRALLVSTIQQLGKERNETSRLSMVSILIFGLQQFIYIRC